MTPPKFHPRLPPPVRRGDRIGVAALSGPVDPERLARGTAALSDLGFEPVPAANLSCRRGLFAGSIRERLEGFHGLLADPTVAAVVFARGGHGLLPLLPHLDWGLLASRPRAFVGYSDVTPLLLAITRRLGWVTFHGPMVAVELARGLSREEEGSFLGALAGRLPRELPLGGAEGGEAVEGPLLGGCLSLLTATLGTPWAAELEGALLFWEDTGEPLYRIDRMLTHLELSHTLSRIRGMVMGHVAPPAEDPVESTHEPRRHEPFGLDAVRRLAAPRGWPIAWGLPAGHEAPNLTVPLGWRVRLEPSVPRLILLGPPREPGAQEPGRAVLEDL